jgi:hypothetical protein
MSRRFVDAWDPKIVPHHRKVTDGVHAHGARIFGQLTHGGHTSLEQPPHILWAPTQMPEPSSHFSTKAIDEDDIRAVIDLGNDAAIEMAGGGLIKGIGAQQPYDQGAAAATATLMALLGQQPLPWIALPGLAVTPENVVEAYQVVWHSPAPPALMKARKPPSAT